jgi:hypothetical protein
MKKRFLIFLVIALVIGACGTAPAASQQPQAVPVAPTAMPAEETSPAVVATTPDEVIIRVPDAIPTPPVGTPTAPQIYQKRGNIEYWGIQKDVELDNVLEAGGGLVLVCASDGPLPIADTIVAIIVIAGITYYVVVVVAPAVIEAGKNLYYSIHWATANTAVAVPNVVEIKSLRNIKGLPEALKGMGELVALKEITSGALYFCGNDGGAGSVEKFGFPSSNGGFFVSLKLSVPCARTVAGILESLRRLLDEAKRLEVNDDKVRLVRIVLEDWIKAFEGLLQ